MPFTQPDTQNTHTWHIPTCHTCTHTTHTLPLPHTTYHRHPIQTHTRSTNTHTYHTPHTPVHTPPTRTTLHTCTHPAHPLHTSSPIQTHCALHHTRTPCTNTYILHTPSPHSTYTHIHTRAHAARMLCYTWCSGPGPMLPVCPGVLPPQALSVLSLGLHSGSLWPEVPSALVKISRGHAPCRKRHHAFLHRRLFAGIQ